jgi:hypothetical protein
MAKTIRKRKGQKMYMMKGCSKGSRPKGSRRQRSLRQQMSNSLRQQMNRSIGLEGGNCTTCQSLNGGSTNALVGDAWSATDGQSQQSSNHYAQNTYASADPQMMMKVRGGRRIGRKSSRGKGSRGKGSRGKGSRGKGRKLKGGSGLMSLVPADLVNLGRDLSFNANSAYSSLTGATQPVNPSVTQQNLPAQVNLHKILV